MGLPLLLPLLLGRFRFKVRNIFSGVNWKIRYEHQSLYQQKNLDQFRFPNLTFINRSFLVDRIKTL
jgi:hypothetical protein